MYVAGGIIGDAQGTITISGCNSVGSVSTTGSGKPFSDHGAGGYAGGIVGHQNSGSITGSTTVFASGYWKSTNYHVGNTTSSKSITVKEAGILWISWTVSSEGRAGNDWDYLKIEQGSESKLQIGSPQNGTGPIVSGFLSLTVTANQTIKFSYRKDGSTDCGEDCATVCWGGALTDSGDGVSVTGNNSFAGGIAGYWNPTSGFGTTTNNANVTSGGSNVGGLVGYCKAGISGGTNLGKIAGNENVGGIVGYTTGTITGTVSNGTSGSINDGIKGRVSGVSWVGGICGMTTNSIGNTSVSSATYAINNYGNITNTGRNCAGIVSYLCTNTGKGVYGCKNHGTITGSSNASGQQYWQTAGIIGKFDVNTTTIKYCCNAGSISSSYCENGGIIGYFTSTSFTVDHCINNGNVSGKGLIGGIVGLISNTSTGTISNCTSNSGKTITATGKVGQNEGGVPDGASVGGIVGGSVATGSITIASTCSNASNVTASSDKQCGGIAGYWCKALDSVSNSGTITGKTYTGGIVGYMTDNLSGCENTGKVSGTSYVGGIAGYATGTISGCTNGDSGKVDDDTIGRVSGTNYVGGIVGETTKAIGNTSLSMTYSNWLKFGNWSVINYGKISGTDRNIAGISGKSSGNNAHLMGCYNEGSIINTGSSYQTAGIVGKMDTATSNIKYCQNNGNITTSHGEGAGIVGCLSQSHTINCCWNQGNIEGSFHAGGIIGWIDGTGTITIS